MCSFVVVDDDDVVFKLATLAMFVHAGNLNFVYYIKHAFLFIYFF